MNVFVVRCLKKDYSVITFEYDDYLDAKIVYDSYINNIGILECELELRSTIKLHEKK